MNFPVHIQKVSGSKGLTAKFALVCEHARKVDVLNMVAQVTSIGASFSTDSAFVGPWPTLGKFDNVFIQRLVPCKRQTVKTQFKIFIQTKSSSERHIGAMAVGNMVVQQILCWECFRTIFASVRE